MSRFVSKSGTWAIEVNAPSRAETPVLKVPYVTKGNTIRVTANFDASPNNGFHYQIQSTTSEVTALSPTKGTVQGTGDQWGSVTRIAFFLVDNVSSQTGVEDVDFEVLFSKQDLDGTGSLSNFTLIGELVTTTDTAG
mgnify:CR=1 FL=1